MADVFACRHCGRPNLIAYDPADPRPSFEEMRLHTELADGIRRELRVEWADVGGLPRSGRLRHGVWTEEMRLSPADPRDDHIRITTSTGMEMTMRWSKAVELLGDNLMYLGG